MNGRGLGCLAWLLVGGIVGAPVAAFIWSAGRLGLSALASGLDTPDARHATVLSILVALATALTGVVFGTCVALAGRRSRIIRLLADLPQTISPVVAGMILHSLWRPDGWLGSPAEAVGLRVLNAWPSLLLASLVMTLPLVPRQLRTVLDGSFDSSEDAARMLGASEWEVLRRVTLPRLRPALRRGAGLAFARSLGEYGAAIVVSGNLMGETQTLTLWAAQEAGDLNQAGTYAAGLVLALLSGVAFAVSRIGDKVRRI